MKILIKHKSNTWDIDFDHENDSIHNLREIISSLTGISHTGQSILLNGSKIKNTRKFTDGCTIGVLGNPIDSPSIVNLKKHSSAKKRGKGKRKKGKPTQIKRIKRIDPRIFADHDTSSTPDTYSNQESSTTVSEPSSTQNILLEDTYSGTIQPKNSGLFGETLMQSPSASIEDPLSSVSTFQSDNSSLSPTQRSLKSSLQSASTSSNNSQYSNIYQPLDITTTRNISPPVTNNTSETHQKSSSLYDLLTSKPTPTLVSLKPIQFPNGLSFSRNLTGRQRAKAIASSFNSISCDIYLDHIEILIQEDRKSEIVEHLNKVAHLTRKEKVEAGVACYATIASVSQLYSSGNTRLILDSSNPFHFSSGTIVRILHPHHMAKADSILSNWHSNLLAQLSNEFSSNIAFPSDIGDMGTIVYARGSQFCVDVSSLKFISPSANQSRQSDSNLSDTSGNRIYIELLDVSTTYQRRIDSLKTLRKFLDASKLKTLASKSILSMSFHPNYNPKVKFLPVKMKPLSLENLNLNETQQNAIQHSLRHRPIAMIHGPPGTGKTTTLVEIIIQLYKQNKRVLVSAASNTAIDNIVLRLMKTSVSEKILRLGSIARFDNNIISTSFEHKLSSYRSRNRYLRKLDTELKTAQKKIITSKSKNDRKEARVAYKKIYKDWKTAQSEVAKDIVESCPIVLSTLTSVHKYFALKPRPELRLFDYGIIDEASQAVEIESWLPLVHCKNVILAGDYMQLAPTVISENALSGGFDCTLFDRLVEKYPSHSTMLTIQYRMNNEILKFSSSRFYHNKLLAHASVATHRLIDLVPSDLKSTPEVILGRKVAQSSVIFFDTSGCAMYEMEQDESKYNPHEAEIVSYCVTLLTKHLLISPHQISIIAPYSAQISHLKSCPELQHISNIKTVDGFQGQENEVVILSLTRSNSDGKVGFLADDRRLNVALTRAKRLLILIGDSETLSTNPFLEDFVNFFTDNASVVPGDAIRDGYDLEPFFLNDQDP